MDAFGTNVIIRCREVSAVWKCHLFHTVFLDENFCPLFNGVCCTEALVNGGSTILLSDTSLARLCLIFSFLGTDLMYIILVIIKTKYFMPGGSGKRFLAGYGIKSM